MHFCYSQSQSIPYTSAHTCFGVMDAKLEAFLQAPDDLKPPLKYVKGFFLQTMRQLVDHANMKSRRSR